MRTHKPVGISIPAEMYEAINRLAAEDGLKRSVWMQQLLIKEIKERISGITTDQLMGTKSPDKPKLTPAQRVALAKLEMAKEAKRPKKSK